ncbi:hypothetical protein AHAS_Ahas19G0333100 [Arachis hypogaea]
MVFLRNKSTRKGEMDTNRCFYSVVMIHIKRRLEGLCSLIFIYLTPSLSLSLLPLNESQLVFNQMGWLQSLLSPLKKLWFRLNSNQNKRRGIYILYEDVKSCQYEDVHVLWSILVESHSPSLPSKK